MRRMVAFSAIVSLLLACVVAWPAPVQGKRLAVPTLPKAFRRSRSLGEPWQGTLERGVRITQSARIRYVTEDAKADHFYGTWQLVQLLERAAHHVQARVPGARLSVGELSRARGGDLAGHASHESGRDVDLGFYMIDAAGRPYNAFAFARFDQSGRGLPPNEGLSFDAPRNFELIARLVTDGEARVQFVFVAPAIKRILLEEGRRRGASGAVLARLARVMVKPSEKHPHGNHFHVRVYCSPNERPKCVDRAPYWPWYPGVPPRLEDPL